MYSRGERSISRASRSSSDSSASRRSSMASAVETSWTTTACPSAIAVSIASSRQGSFIDKSSCAKKRCLVPSKIDSAADLAPELSVPPVSVSTIRVTSSASRRFAWMIAYREVAVMRRNAANARNTGEHFATSFTLFHRVSSHSIRLASRFHDGGTLLATGAPTCSSALRLVSRLACA